MLKKSTTTALLQPPAFCAAVFCAAIVGAFTLLSSPVLGQEEAQTKVEAQTQTTKWQLPTDTFTLARLNEWHKEASRKELPYDASELAQQIVKHPNQRHGLLLDSLAELFPFTKTTVATLQQPPLTTEPWRSLIDEATVADKRLPESAAQFLKLACGCWLARHGRYDDALDTFKQLPIEESLDPTAQLFYGGLAHHRLLQNEHATKQLTTLLEHENELPTRFAKIGNMMLADIEALKPDSLREVSRLMQDAQRRQALHRSGQRVLDQERAVISKLDQMIAKLEEDLQKLQQQQQPQSAPAQGSQPMEQDSAAGGKGDGEVANIPMTDGGDWGNLPPKQRAAVLAEITRDLPPHYREVIEEYFRQLARQTAPSSPSSSDSPNR